MHRWMGSDGRRLMGSSDVVTWRAACPAKARPRQALCTAGGACLAQSSTTLTTEALGVLASLTADGAAGLASHGLAP
jgi:hypothetical protein